MESFLIDPFQKGGVIVKRYRWSSKWIIRGALLAVPFIVTGCANSLAAGGGGPAASSASGASGAKSAAAGRAVTTPGKTAGTANVAYAGSLQLVNDEFVAPLFTRATGIPYRGQGGGALGVAHMIAAGELTPNVFESIGTAPVKLLMPKFTRFAIGYASSPLVVAYSPTSPFAPELRAIASGRKPLRDLFLLMERRNFHLGRTNPNTDPQGQAFILMLQLANEYEHLPKGTAARILGGLVNPRQIFAEEAILSRLQAGQLDAASAFLSEAVQRHLPYIALPRRINLGDPAFAARYRTQSLRLSDGQIVRGAPLEIYATTVSGTPDSAAGRSYLSFLLSPAGRKIFQKEGYTLTKPQIFGAAAAIPPGVRKQIAR